MAGEPTTKDGDVVIRCFADKPTPHRVGLIVKDGDLVGSSPEVVLGRVEAIRRAEALRGDGGRIFLQEDDRWSEIK